MQMRHGFQLEIEEKIQELGSVARLFRHLKTGAELLSLSNDDENKVFGITFRTPPSDSTGVAHILEHSVLCGSRRYPLKEPFVELLKGSLNTFLNAFTYPDKTCYPVASQNLQDFYNLIDVYLDAVFYPRLTPFIFQQEGWHYELDDPSDSLSYKGVVFNEMKGAYSSADRLLVEHSLQSLFLGHPYGLDSGGDPKQIPALTYDQFRDFHRKYYHPSNSRIYFYGDDDPEKRLKIADQYLKGFDPISIDSNIPPQTPFSKPRRLEYPFTAGEEESRQKGMMTLNWLFPETTDVETNFALRILEYILLGMPASPLRKALLDSGLGEDICGEGLSRELRQMYFSTGLKGIDMDHCDQVEQIIVETLQGLVRDGIHPNTIKAALNTVEFRLRENNSGHLPRGLILMLRSLTTWLYGGSPTALLAFEAPLKRIRSKAVSNKTFFEDMIQQFFFDNTQRTRVLLKPDANLREREEADEKGRLEAARSTMDPKALDALVQNTLDLKKAQETPDSPEALASIPCLRLRDLDKKEKVLPIEVMERQGTPLLFHSLSTHGIIYLDIGFDLHALPDKYLAYVPLFGRALVETGTEKEDFVALSQRISRKTGGVRPSSFASAVRNRNQCAARLFLRGKAMLGQTEELISILREVLLTARLDNRERFRQMVMEEKARAEQLLIPGGHHIVDLRLRSHFSEAGWASEQMEGVTNLFFLRDLAEAVDKNWSEIQGTLEEMRRLLINRKAGIVNVTFDETEYSGIEPHLNSLIDALPEGSGDRHGWSLTRPALSEGMIISSKVNYVGKGANLFQMGYRYNGSATVITRYLRTAWLWDQIRVKGGAYGVFCLFDRHSGTMTLVSYRDPNISETIDVYDRTARFLREIRLPDTELTKAIIGAIGDLDAHLLPDRKGYVSMVRHLTEDSLDIRQQMREEILATNVSHFREFGHLMERVKEGGIVKILGSQGAIEVSSSGEPGWLSMIKVL
ncbi:MAG: insulinase family protein [Thermodesulfobacteriota bacterium]|nr:insulinase family protein [Thermodesulfobacteriota bacterium]